MSSSPAEARAISQEASLQQALADSSERKRNSSDEYCRWPYKQQQDFIWVNKRPKTKIPYDLSLKGEV